MANLVLLSGSGQKELVERMGRRLGRPAGRVVTRRLGNGETAVEVGESVRGKDVYVVQSGGGEVNDVLMELTMLLRAVSTASAARVTAVLPCFPYALQDRKERPRAPITAKLVANMLSLAGAQHVITMDLHSSQVQGFFDVPVDNLFAEAALAAYMKEKVEGWELCCLVSPDAGGAKRVVALADRLGLPFAIIHQGRRRNNTGDEDSGSLGSGSPPLSTAASSSPSKGSGASGSSASTSPRQSSEEEVVVADRGPNVVAGKVRGLTAVVVDDVVDSCGTVAAAAETLLEAGAAAVHAIAVHGRLSGCALERLEASALKSLAVTNTLPQEDNLRSCAKLRLIDVAAILAEAVRRNHNGESVSHLFHNVPN